VFGFKIVGVEEQLHNGM